jgi:hypothetical protein
MVTMSDFGLDDWPPGGVSRDHAVHVAYLRAARRAGVRAAGYVSPLDVARRDNWTCSGCGGPVPERWTAVDLNSAPALAYVSPLADGGGHSARNVRLAHLRCAPPADGKLAAALRRALAGVPTTKTRASRADTHCTKGHELAGANLLKSSDGRRRCRQCRNDRESGRDLAGTTAKRA